MQSATLTLQDTLYNSSHPTRKWLHCTRRDWILAAIDRTCRSPDMTAIEIGPGSGLYLPELARRAHRVDAADIANEFLERATALSVTHPNICSVLDDITASKIPDASYDLVLCTEVIEHMPDSASALKHMFRILKPSGALILSTPQRHSFMELACKVAFLPGIIEIARAVYREPVLETGHINLLTAGQARGQIEAAGFQVSEQAFSGLYLPLVAELTGKLGLKLERALEDGLKAVNLTWPLWTQYYIARKDA
jgi:ubiquinone/menaquinone biosynthesis C-methylase UbiE